jgi:hypothetical protein
VGTGRYPSNGQVASSAITVRLRRPPHDHSMKLRCRLLQLFLMDGVLTGNIQPRLTTGAFDFWPKVLCQGTASGVLKHVPTSTLSS